jgi:3-hydroxyacyl-CoA dehydrogenase
MELGMIGLGRMGTNMVRRLMRAGHHCTVYDLHQEAIQALAKDGAAGAKSLEDFAHKHCAGTMRKNFIGRLAMRSPKSRLLLRSMEYVKEHSHGEATKRIDKRREQRDRRNQVP